MKLKLDQQSALTILSVSEAIDPKQLPVLRAGVVKLIQQPEGRPLIIDLTSAQANSLENAEVVNTLTSLRQSAAAAGRRVLIACARAGLGDAPTAAACAALLQGAGAGPAPAPAASAPAASASAPAAPAAKAAPGTPEQEEAALQATLEGLKTERANAQKSIDARAGESDEIRRLQRENNQIKRLIRVIETEVGVLLRSRAVPLEMTDDLKTKLIDVGQVLESVTQMLSAAKAKGAKA